jgi:hypothetical protein
MSEKGEINISRIPVAGVGGLGMVAIAVIVAIALPGLRWLAIASLAGGLVAGLALIAARHRPMR